MKPLSAIRRYFEDADSDAQARNTIAAVVLSNMPFYPLYAAWIVGSAAWPTLLSFLAMPLFAIVPRLNRLGATAGQWGLVIAGLLDTGLCAAGLGAGTGVEAFYGPIALLPAVLYRNSPAGRRVAMAAAVVAVFGLGWLIDRPPMFAPADLRSLTILHLISAGALCVLILILRWRIHKSPSSA